MVVFNPRLLLHGLKAFGGTLAVEHNTIQINVGSGSLLVCQPIGDQDTRRRCSSTQPHSARQGPLARTELAGEAPIIPPSPRHSAVPSALPLPPSLVFPPAPLPPHALTPPPTCQTLFSSFDIYVAGTPLPLQSNHTPSHAPPGSTHSTLTPRAHLAQALPFRCNVGIVVAKLIVRAPGTVAPNPTLQL